MQHCALQCRYQRCSNLDLVQVLSSNEIFGQSLRALISVMLCLASLFGEAGMQSSLHEAPAIICQSTCDHGVHHGTPSSSQLQNWIVNPALPIIGIGRAARRPSTAGTKGTVRRSSPADTGFDPVPLDCRVSRRRRLTTSVSGQSKHHTSTECRANTLPHPGPARRRNTARGCGVKRSMTCVLCPD